MNTLITKLISFLLLVVVPYMISSVCNAIAFTPKVHVQLTNDLAPGFDLTLHCKSGEDDLGERVLPFHQSFNFHFRESVMGRTLFFCSMEWNGAVHRFDVYVQYRDDDKCGKHCLWFIRPAGPCLMVNQTTTNICYDWPSY
ncbi:hypothetical protein ACOSP7_006542 [Xanthoceras sorbifolium]